MIKIDENKCTGCNLCIPSCPEGALKIVETPKGPKVRLVKEFYCDGLGACIGHCPEGALAVVDEEVEVYNEKKVMENIIKGGEDKIGAHLNHLKEHSEKEYLKEAVQFIKENNIDFDLSEYIAFVQEGMEIQQRGRPGSGRTLDLTAKGQADVNDSDSGKKAGSELKNWPLQIKLVSPNASYLKKADLLITADCVAFAYGDFHRDFIKDKVVLIGCPKLDNIDFYIDKLAKIFEINNPNSVTVMYMEVPCCSGLVSCVQEAIKRSGKTIPCCDVKVGLKGEVLR